MSKFVAIAQQMFYFNLILWKTISEKTAVVESDHQQLIRMYSTKVSDEQLPRYGQ